MRYIPLTQGKLTLVDDEDFEKFGHLKWQYDKKNNTASRGMFVKGKYKRVYLHREIMNARKGMVVDHKNHNQLDNRKENLRVCTHSQNMANKFVMAGREYMGVRCRRNRWYAVVKYKGKAYEIWSFDTAKQAALAYDLWAVDLFGEFAMTNFPRA